MANVTDSASLLTILSGWSNGVLGSLKPDDGTGDFTFSRGSDLSATRVNEDGYIEKGYENMVMHSNEFDNPIWSSNNTNVSWDITSGHEGYDGNNNAWSIGKSVSTAAYWHYNSGIAFTGIVTHSLYAKSGSLNGLLMFGGTPVLRLNLDTGLTYSWTRGLIYLNVTDAGNGWKKIVFASLDVSLQIQPQDADNNLSAAGNIYIQNYQVNQGLVERPYLNSGATPAYSGILEDQPRIDYSNGTNGNILLEPQSTNLIVHSEYFDGWVKSGTPGTTPNATISPEGVQNAYLLKSNGISDRIQVSRNLTGPHNQGLFIKYAGDNVTLRLARAQSNDRFEVNVTVSGVTLSNAQSAITDYIIKEFGNGWYYINNIQDGMLYYQIYIDVSGGNGSVYAWGAKAEEGEELFSSYIPTYGISTTRAKDTATLTKNVASTGTIYININSNSTKTLTFLGGNVSVTQGVNKIAMAYSPTALKISHNGSVVQNITRAFDTSALTQIQLGHRNNFEQTTDGINQFLTLDSFLSDADLNELTA